jgi:3-hydroxyisobutyrate dehydrogenase-like beta-hydroxyacid dehydrogenase
VLGSIGEAEGGTLTIFVGGDDDVVERCMPLLAHLGTPIHVGGFGAGAAAKLVANSTLVTVIAALGEALALADALGLERDVAFQVLGTTALAAQAERRREAIESGDFSPRFKLELALKDAGLIEEAAEASGVDLRLVPAAQSWLADAERAGLGDRDYSAVLAQILG